jgi:hypothetical protein
MEFKTITNAENECILLNYLIEFTYSSDIIKDDPFSYAAFAICKRWVINAIDDNVCNFFGISGYCGAISGLERQDNDTSEIQRFVSGCNLSTQCLLNLYVADNIAYENNFTPADSSNHIIQLMRSARF